VRAWSLGTSIGRRVDVCMAHGLQAVGLAKPVMMALQMGVCVYVCVCVCVCVRACVTKQVQHTQTRFTSYNVPVTCSMCPIARVDSGIEDELRNEFCV